MRPFKLTCLLLVVFINPCYSVPRTTLGRCGRVHLTVSSAREGCLEMNYIMDCADRKWPDTISLFFEDPKKVRNASAVATISTDEYPIGHYTTDVVVDTRVLPSEWIRERKGKTKRKPGPRCFPVWIASIRKKEILDSACLKIQPTWMNDNRKTIGKKKLGDLFIPGTHNSGAYTGVPAFMEKVVLNQERNIWTQLVFGIRYLDFRVGFYHGDGFSINHDLVRIATLEPLLRQIADFMKAAPEEIVILDLHRFPYPTSFTRRMHLELASTIFNQLSEFILPPNGYQVGRGPKLNDIWDQKMRLIVCYNDKEIVQDHPWMWNPLQQYWGDKRLVGDLRDYMETVIQTHKTGPNPMWALMAELTIRPMDVILGIYTNRKLAGITNRHLTRWFRDEWSHHVNIVATDYFLGNDLINVAIDANRRK